MTFLLSQTPARGELYSSAAGDFTVTVNAGTKTVTISDPGFALTPNAIQVAQLWTVSGTIFSKQDIPINTIGISGFVISFEDLGSNFVGTERVEIFILGPKKTITETNSGSIKTAVEQAQTILTAIRDTAGIKKITDAITEGNSADILAALNAIKNTDGIKKITDDVEVVQPDAAALLNTEVNSGSIKTAVESLVTLITAVKNTDGIKKIVDAITETNSADIKTAVEALVAALFSDDSAFTAGTDKGVLALAAASADAVDSGDLGALQMTTFRELVIAGFSALINALRTSEINPANMWYLPEEPFDGSALAIDTHEAYIDMTGFKYLTLLGLIGAGSSGDLTVNFYGTTQDDGTAPDSCEYGDEPITSYMSGGEYEEYVFTDAGSLMSIGDKPLPFKYVKVEVVTTGAADWTFQLLTKKMF